MSTPPPPTPDTTLFAPNASGKQRAKKKSASKKSAKKKTKKKKGKH